MYYKGDNTGTFTFTAPDKKAAINEVEVTIKAAGAIVLGFYAKMYLVRKGKAVLIKTIGGTNHGDTLRSC